MSCAAPPSILFITTQDFAQAGVGNYTYAVALRSLDNKIGAYPPLLFVSLAVKNPVVAVEPSDSRSSVRGGAYAWTCLTQINVGFGTSYAATQPPNTHPHPHPHPPPFPPYPPLFYR